MTEGIFREAAVERLSTPDRLDQGLSIVGHASWVMLAALAALVVGGLIWSIVLAVPVTVRGQGILLTPGGVLDVTSESPGRVISFSIKVGDRIEAGSVVARLDQPDLRQELLNAEAERRDAVEERDQIVDFQQRRAPVLAASVAQRRRAFEDDLVLLAQQLHWLGEAAKVDEDLAAKELTTRQKVFQTQVDIGKTEEEQAQAQNGIRNLEVEVSKSEIEDQRERLSSELKIAAAERKIRSLQERLDRQSVVLSPYAGTVMELKVNAGEIVERNGALFSLLPSEAADASKDGVTADTRLLYAIVYVPPGDGKKVRPGMAVRIAPSTVHREEFGFIEGRVRSVAEFPSTLEGMNRTLKNRQLVQSLAKDGAPFELVVDLIPDPKTPSGYRWSSSRGPDAVINGGTLASADIDVKSVPILGLIVPPLRRLLEGNS